MFHNSVTISQVVYSPLTGDPNLYYIFQNTEICYQDNTVILAARSSFSVY